MSKRAVWWIAGSGALLYLAAVGSAWQKAAEVPADVKVAQVASAKAAPAAKEATPPKPAAFLPGGESLNYSLVWPGGASLGEAHLRASRSDSGWRFDYSLDASVPGFAISDHYRSHANADFCSTELEKETTHGSHHTHEKTVFDYKEGSATRTTLVDGGGHTDISINNCAHDGLDYIYYARQQLSQGHGVPQQEDVLFGASYSARMQFAGVTDVTVGKKHYQADHVNVFVKGPASDYELEIYFERDAARTPLVIKAPLPVGNLSMELVR